MTAIESFERRCINELQIQHVIMFHEAHCRQCGIALVMWLTVTQWLRSFNNALPHRKPAEPLQDLESLRKFARACPHALLYVHLCKARYGKCMSALVDRLQLSACCLDSKLDAPRLRHTSHILPTYPTIRDTYQQTLRDKSSQTQRQSRLSERA